MSLHTGRVIRIDEATALLAKPYAILGCSPAFVRKVFVETRTALRSSGDVRSYAEAHRSPVRTGATRWFAAVWV